METISMSGKERRRLEVFSRVKAREFSLARAADLLGISGRQAKRIWARYRDEGDAGLVHRLRGRASNRQPQPIRKEQALELYREKYAGYGPTLAAECMERDDGLAAPTSTLRRWLTSAELWKQQRRRKQHRRRRPRREHYGELVQLDGSHHDWFEGRRGLAVLMVMIDDATGLVFAQFFENESWDSAATTLRRYTQTHGLPLATAAIVQPGDRVMVSEQLDGLRRVRRRRGVVAVVGVPRAAFGAAQRTAWPNRIEPRATTESESRMPWQAADGPPRSERHATGTYSGGPTPARRRGRFIVTTMGLNPSPSGESLRFCSWRARFGVTNDGMRRYWLTLLLCASRRLSHDTDSTIRKMGAVIYKSPS